MLIRSTVQTTLFLVGPPESENCTEQRDEHVATPAFNLRNPLMVYKHVRLAVLSEMVFQSCQPGSVGEQVKEMLRGHLLPFIRAYLFDADDCFREAPPVVADAVRPDG